MGDGSNFKAKLSLVEDCFRLDWYEDQLVTKRKKRKKSKGYRLIRKTWILDFYKLVYFVKNFFLNVKIFFLNVKKTSYIYSIPWINFIYYQAMKIAAFKESVFFLKLLAIARTRRTWDASSDTCTDVFNRALPVYHHLG